MEPARKGSPRIATARSLFLATAMGLPLLATPADVSAAPYTCYNGARDAEEEMMWAAIFHTDGVAAGANYTLESGCVGYRTTPFPVACHQYTQPYTDRPTDFDPTRAYQDAFQHGSIHVTYDLHTHPIFHQPMGFSEADKDEIPIGVDFGILLEYQGDGCFFWLSTYNTATGEISTGCFV
jgi:hypothetical protein